jgi:hypothetical protein
MFNNFLFRKSCHLWDKVENIIQRSRPQMTIWHMRVACWIPKATNTHSPYTYNTYCLSTTTIMARTRLIVTLHIYGLYCCSILSRNFKWSPPFCIHNPARLKGEVTALLIVSSFVFTQPSDSMICCKNSSLACSFCRHALLVSPQ